PTSMFALSRATSVRFVRSSGHLSRRSNLLLTLIGHQMRTQWFNSPLPNTSQYPPKPAGNFTPACDSNSCSSVVVHCDFWLPSTTMLSSSGRHLSVIAHLHNAAPPHFTYPSAPRLRAAQGPPEIPAKLRHPWRCVR